MASTLTRVCKTCGLEKAAYMFKRRRSCEVCVAAAVRVCQRAWYERNKERARKKAREWARKARAEKAAAYEREKARKRLRYRFDPEWRAAELQRFAARRERLRGRAA